MRGGYLNYLSREEIGKWYVKNARQEWIMALKVIHKDGAALACGWNILTTYIDEIELDMTEYSLYINNECDVSIEKIKYIARIANVNYVTVKQMLGKKKF